MKLYFTNKPIVREQKGLIRLGKIQSKELLKYVGRKIKSIEIEVVY